MPIADLARTHTSAGTFGVFQAFRTPRVTAPIHHALVHAQPSASSRPSHTAFMNDKTTWVQNQKRRVPTAGNLKYGTRYKCYVPGCHVNCHTVTEVSRHFGKNYNVHPGIAWDRSQVIEYYLEPPVNSDNMYGTHRRASDSSTASATTSSDVSPSVTDHTSMAIIPATSGRRIGAMMFPNLNTKMAAPSTISEDVLLAQSQTQTTVISKPRGPPGAAGIGTETQGSSLRQETESPTTSLSSKGLHGRTTSSELGTARLTRPFKSMIPVIDGQSSDQGSRGRDSLVGFSTVTYPGSSRPSRKRGREEQQRPTSSSRLSTKRTKITIEDEQPIVPNDRISVRDLSRHSSPISGTNSSAPSSTSRRPFLKLNPPRLSSLQTTMEDGEIVSVTRDNLQMTESGSQDEQKEANTSSDDSTPRRMSTRLSKRGAANGGHGSNLSTNELRSSSRTTHLPGVSAEATHVLPSSATASPQASLGHGTTTAEPQDDQQAEQVGPDGSLLPKTRGFFLSRISDEAQQQAQELCGSKDIDCVAFKAGSIMLDDMKMDLDICHMESAIVKEKLKKALAKAQSDNKALEQSLIEKNQEITDLVAAKDTLTKSLNTVQDLTIEYGDRQDRQIAQLRKRNAEQAEKLAELQESRHLNTAA